MTLGALGIDDAKLSELTRLADQADQHFAALARVIEEFSAWGWAPSGMVPTSPYLEALRALDGGAPRDEVEQIILRGWQESTLEYLGTRLRGVGQEDLGYGAIFS